MCIAGVFLGYKLTVGDNIYSQNDELDNFSEQISKFVSLDW